ncbi:MAG TPA: HD domain-containing phosphohydrolase [Pyrinomonadaceae bacterium]|nr:HD domain-containing phosphohydrolase [Pyrinomonadaceae bacterium]
MTNKLLIVDDEPANLRVLKRLFSREFHCLTASSGAEAIRLLEQHDVAILISDQRMPMMTGIELLKQSANLRPNMVRLLLTGYTDVEALVEALNCGLVYRYVTKPWSNDDLKLIVSRACQHYESNKKSSTLALANVRLETRLQETKQTVVTALFEMVSARDEYAHGHALRVSKTASLIAERMGLSEEAKAEISAAALLHNLGHVANTGKAVYTGCFEVNLNPSVRAHSACEARLLAAIPELETIADTIKFLRENFDGSGSPTGLKAEGIPLLSRILRVADEYDLLVLPRASASLTYHEAMRFLKQRSARQFDPDIVELLSQMDPEALAHSQTPAISNPEFSGRSNFDPSYADALFS